MEVIGKFSNPEDAILLLHKNILDLAFLDVDTYHQNGIDLRHETDYLFQRIFTSSRTKPLIDMFDLNASGYLLKPISYSDFLRAVSKTKIQFAKKSAFSVNMTPSGHKYSNYELEGSFIRTESELNKLNFNDIKYIHTPIGINKIYLKNTTIPVLTTLKKEHILENLPNHFLQVNDDFIINFSLNIVANKRRVIVDKTHIPIGRAYQDKVIHVLGEYLVKSETKL